MRRTTPRANAGGEKDNLQTSCFVISRSPVRIRATASRELRGDFPAEGLTAKPDRGTHEGIAAPAILEAWPTVARQAPANAARTPFGGAQPTLHRSSPAVAWPVDRSRRRGPLAQTGVMPSITVLECVRLYLTERYIHLSGRSARAALQRSASRIRGSA